MLSQKACKQCRKESEGDKVFTIWMYRDDVNWHNGFVNCPSFKSFQRCAVVKALPPKWCEYALEHIVNHEEKKS
jgi:hypothetical protein